MKPTLRIESIDLLRGLIIVIMAIDHVRDYFSAAAFSFDPTDMTQTTVPIFLTRWITHFCAPVFVFLAGTSAWLIGNKKGPQELSSFLLKRGLWLIFLEFTIINFGWFFNIHFSFLALTVIWVLGIGMVFLAGLSRLPYRLLLILSVLIIIGHNALDGIHVTEEGAGKVAWGLLHDQTFFVLGEKRFLFIGYAIIPWIAVMSLGYCVGKLYGPEFDPARRRKILMQAGVACSLGFVVLRATNLYGDPNPWAVQGSFAMTVCSFLNCSKYPPSLLYLSMTLGPALIFLAATEFVSTIISRALTVIGRVPLFFYVLHIYLIHLLALIGAALTGYPLSAMIFNTWITNSPDLKGYGFGLGIVYLVWAFVIISLYPVCKWFDSYKRANRDKEWLSYC